MQLEVTILASRFTFVYMFRDELCLWWRQAGDLYSVTTRGLLKGFVLFCFPLFCF